MNPHRPQQHNHGHAALQQAPALLGTGDDGGVGSGTINPRFEADKLSWENAIRAYNENDPLDLWYNYICWYEQNHAYDRTNNLGQILEKCLSLFQDNETFKQDIRMVKLWMKYIDMQQAPASYYQRLFKKNIGTQCASFYIGWAHYFDAVNAFKQVESIYNLGIQMNARPMEELQEAQRIFRLSLANRGLCNDPLAKKRSANIMGEQLPIVSLSPPHKRVRHESSTGDYQLSQQTPSGHHASNVAVCQHANGGLAPEVTHAPSTGTTFVNNMYYHQQRASQQAMHQHQLHQQLPHASSIPPIQEHGHYYVKQHNGTYYPSNGQHDPYQQRETIDTSVATRPPSPTPAAVANHHHPHEIDTSSEETYHSSPHRVQYQQTLHEPQRAEANGIQSGEPVAGKHCSNADDSLIECNLNNSAYVITASLSYVYDDPDLAQYTLTEETQPLEEAREPQGPQQLPAPQSPADFDEGIRLPLNFVRDSKSNHETWDVPLCLEEPYDPKRRCCYPKRLVYPDLHAERPTMEFSLEEIRAQRWHARRRQQQEHDQEAQKQAKLAQLEKEKLIQRQRQMKYPQHQRAYPTHEYPSSSGHPQQQDEHSQQILLHSHHQQQQQLHATQAEQTIYNHGQQQQQLMRQGSIQHTSNFYHQQQQQPHGPYHGYNNGYNQGPGGQTIPRTSPHPVQSQLAQQQNYHQSTVIQSNHHLHQAQHPQQHQQHNQLQHHYHQHGSPAVATQLHSPTPTATAVQQYQQPLGQQLQQHQQQYAPVVHSHLHSPPTPYHQQPAQRQYDGYNHNQSFVGHQQSTATTAQANHSNNAAHQHIAHRSYQSMTNITTPYAPESSPHGQYMQPPPASQETMTMGRVNHQNYTMNPQSPNIQNSSSHVGHHHQHHAGHGGNMQVSQQFPNRGHAMHQQQQQQQQQHVHQYHRQQQQQQQEQQQHQPQQPQHQQYNHVNAPEKPKVQQTSASEYHAQHHVQRPSQVVQQTRIDAKQYQEQQQQSLPTTQPPFEHQPAGDVGTYESYTVNGGANGSYPNEGQGGQIKEYQQQCQQQQQQQQQQYHHQHRVEPQNINNNNGKYTSNRCDDIEEQIEASTIRFSTSEENGTSKSKTITIKFKKEKTGAGSPLAAVASESSIRSPYQSTNAAHSQPPIEQQHPEGGSDSGAKKHGKHAFKNHTLVDGDSGVGKSKTSGGKGSRSHSKRKTHSGEDVVDARTMPAGGQPAHSRMDDANLLLLLSHTGRPAEKDEDSSFSVQSQTGSGSSVAGAMTKIKKKKSKRSEERLTSLKKETRKGGPAARHRYELDEEEYRVEEDGEVEEDEDGAGNYAGDDEEEEDDNDDDDGVQDEYCEEEEEEHENGEQDEDAEEEEEEEYFGEEEEETSTEEGTPRVRGRRGNRMGEQGKRIVRPDEDDSNSYQSNSEFNTSFSNISFAGDNSNGPFQYGSGGGGAGSAGGAGGIGSVCSTPIRRTQTSSVGGFSKTSTPVSSFRYLRKHESNLSNLGQNEDSMSSTVVENSFFQAGEHDEEANRRRLEKALATIETHLAKPFVDPFSNELCRAFLTKVNFPARESTDNHYRITNANLPKLAKGQTTNLGGTGYSVEKEVGRGSYGSVFRAVNAQTGAIVAIKYQKPANTWELYICTEVKKRLTNVNMLPGFMDICAAVIAPNASVLVSEFSQYGSLLDINNKIRTATTKVMHESLVMHFSCQILSIVEYLHSCNIIHADIKPDNFLLMKIPSRDLEAPTIRLIDFGCAIDMNFFEPKQQFKKVIQTDGFTCIEMQEGRPWSFQTDLFCVAGTIHVMLFGEYMQLVKKYECGWDIKQKLPRYLKKTVWTEVFQKLLNIEDIDHMPSLPRLRELINSEAYKMDSELTKHIRTLSNLLKSR